MPMKPSRSVAEVEKVRQQILVASLGIIVSEGFAALSMRKLAKAVGMSAPNLYNYFANKDEIYITLMINGFHRLVECLTQARETKKDVLKRAKAMLMAYIQFGIENKQYYEIMFSSNTPKYTDYIGTAQEALSKQEHEVSMALAALAEETIAEVAMTYQRKLKRSEIATLLTMIWSLVHGMVSLHNSKNIDYVLDNPVGQYKKIVASIVDQIPQKIA